MTEVLAEPCVRPAGFDLAAFWSESSRAFLTRLPQYRATVRAAPAALRLIRLGGRWARVEEESPPDGAGWTTLRILFETEEGAREFVLGFGTAIEVVAPEELRMQVVREARGILALYEEREQSGAGPTGTRPAPQ